MCPGSEEDSVGMLADDLSDSGSEQLHYEDFFDPPRGVVAGHTRQEEGEETGEKGREKGSEPLSTHEKRQQQVGAFCSVCCRVI